MKINELDFSGDATGNYSVAKLSDFATERLRQKEKTKRLLITGEFLLVAFAASIMLFAPKEKEKVAYIIGAILLVLALGAIGASKFVFKFFGLIVDTRNMDLLKCQSNLYHCSQTSLYTQLEDQVSMYDRCSEASLL